MGDEDRSAVTLRFFYPVGRQTPVRMVRDPYAEEEQPETEEVLDTLSDSDCRSIIEGLDEPLSASEVSDRCDIPQSTTYRKLDRLTETTLLRETTEIRKDGRHTARYEVDFEDVRVFLDDERTLTYELSRPARTADERLASMWSEVQKEL